MELQHSNKKADVERPLVIEVPTVTLVLRLSDNPYQVVIGWSKKHDKPVLPGGKIDSDDIVNTNIEKCAKHAALREIKEEVGATVKDLQLLTISSDPESDVRDTTIGALKGSLAAEQWKELPSDMKVKALYGIPDYVFIGEVNLNDIGKTEELYDVAIIDVREAAPPALASNHNSYLESYLARIKNQ